MKEDDKRTMTPNYSDTMHPTTISVKVWFTSDIKCGPCGHKLSNCVKVNPTD